MEMWSYNRLILKTGQSSLQVDVYSKIVLSFIQGMVFYEVLVGSLRGLVRIFCQDQNGWLVSQRSKSWSEAQRTDNSRI